MHDGVTLEAQGLPVAVVVTTEFLHEATVQRAALGMDGLRPVVITHPLSSLTDAEIDSRIAEVVAQASEVWLGAVRSEVKTR
jgi:hypothetical protein